jgi:hypothetical protein
MRATENGKEHLVKYGPVDVVILATDEAKIDGSILAALGDAVEAGSIRVLDAMMLAMDEDGKRFSLDIEDLGPEAKEKLGFIDTGTRGLFDSEDTATLFEGMVPGSVVLALALENAWAVPVMNAFEAAGAQLALHTRIPAVIIDDALAALAAAE